MEYRAVKTESGVSLFERGPFPEGTNNIGEFLGIVETLMLLHAEKDVSPVYSDSRNAIAWVAVKGMQAQLVRNTRKLRSCFSGSGRRNDGCAQIRTGTRF